MYSSRWFRICASICGVAAALAVFQPPALAEEGMWTFDNLPVKALQEKYGFTPTQEWLDHVRLASVRFSDGGSGSFVSPTGLVMTNHHVAVGQLQKVSSEKQDYVTNGFFAATPAEEMKCPDLELNVLVSMEDVTAKVLAAVKPGMSEEEAVKARDAARAAIEKENMDRTGLRSDVVGLYHGGEYWLYSYKKYTDIRLVMAPERQAAYYGGDYDNFTYPRFDLDMAFFRVYEDGKPLASEHYLKWNRAGAGKDELVFVPGHPGGSDRLLTTAQLNYQRDYTYPRQLRFIERMMAALTAYSAKGEEQARRGLVMLFGFANAKKGYEGYYKSLTDERVMARQRQAEADLREKVAANPEWQALYGSAWERLEKVYREHGQEMARRSLRDTFAAGFGAQLNSLAVAIALYAHEMERPDGERMSGFHDSELDSLRFQLLSPAPVYRDLEAAMLELLFRFALDEVGPDDPLTRIIAGLGDPAAAAARLAEGTHLDDVAVRKQLLEGGVAALEKSDDPLIVLARQVAPLLREDYDWQKETISSVTVPAGEQVAKARFAVYGRGAYPDATFTLRLTFGPVRGYPMNGTIAPYKTTLYGLFDRALGFDQEGDWQLPRRYWDRQKDLDLATPVNFVCECDIIGGNSGSPVINRQAEVVGLVFDGNIESLANNYVFDPERSRAVAVHTGYITAALRKLYDAGALADELEKR